MKEILLGYRPYDFKDDDGRQVKGVSLFTQFQNEHITGYGAAKRNVADIPKNIDDYLGVELDVFFNDKGRVEQISYPKPAGVSAPFASASGDGKK